MNFIWLCVKASWDFLRNLCGILMHFDEFDPEYFGFSLNLIRCPTGSILDRKAD